MRVEGRLFGSKYVIMFPQLRLPEKVSDLMGKYPPILLSAGYSFSLQGATGSRFFRVL